MLNYVLFLFIIGLFIGSFLNVLIERLPKNKSILGRSRCDFCKKTLKTKDLIPLLSFVYLKGSCRYCKKPLSFQYPIVEILTGVLFVLTFIYVTAGSIFNFQFLIFNEFIIHKSLIINLFFYFFIISTFIVIFFTDLKYQIIPDKILLLGVLLTFAYIVFTSFNSGVVYQSLFDYPLFIHTITGILAFLFFLIIFLVTRGRGMGFGDVKLSFLIGLILGPISAFLALYIAFLTGAGIGIILILWKKKGLKSKIPFGPFLVIGAFISFLFSEELVRLLSPLF